MSSKNAQLRIIDVGVGKTHNYHIGQVLAVYWQSTPIADRVKYEVVFINHVEGTVSCRRVKYALTKPAPTT